MKDYTAIATRYAKDVLSGEILACRYVHLACKRFIREMKAQQKEDFPFVYDSAKAHWACWFVEAFPHVKGKWARHKELLVMQPWQVFVMCNVLGWMRRDDGLRRYRTAYVEIPRKNGKSAWSAAIGLYMLAGDGEEGAEVYTGATTQDQAHEVFRPAKHMASRTDDFREEFGVEVFASNIAIPENGSFMRPLIGKPGDGSSPSCAIVDEYHEHETDELFDTMLTGMAAREQPLMWVITTAGSNIAGPCYALRSDVIAELEGTREGNGETFGIIYTIDEGMDWTSEEALRMANPNYGVSVDPKFLRAQIIAAVNSSRKQNITKTKHLNVWVTAREAWMNMEAWNRQADRSLKLEDFEGEECWMGLDLASKIDIASSVKLFRRTIDGYHHYYLFGRHYLPDERVSDPEKQHYQGWHINGELIATEGDIIDHGEIASDIFEDAERFRIQRIGYDPYNATQLAVALTDRRIDAVEVRMVASQLSDPMKWLEALVLAGRFHHDGNEAMNWMMSNVVCKTDANDNIFPRKERPENKIDGAVATIIALAVAMREPEKKPVPKMHIID